MCSRLVQGDGYVLPFSWVGRGQVLTPCLGAAASASDAAAVRPQDTCSNEAREGGPFNEPRQIGEEEVEIMARNSEALSKKGGTSLEDNVLLNLLG